MADLFLKNFFFNKVIMYLSLKMDKKNLRPNQFYFTTRIDYHIKCYYFFLPVKQLKINCLSNIDICDSIQ